MTHHSRHRWHRPVAMLAAALMTLLLGACFEFDTPEVKRYITDSQGRALVLHGTNASNGSKHAADHQPWFDEAYVEREANQWGFNFVRYLVFWAAIEPEKGVYDEAYLDEVEKRVKWYTDRGVHVVIDMHQDIYGYGVGGNGAPVWATETDGKTAGQVPLQDKFWWLGYIDPAVINAFRNFWEYDRHRYLQDHYIAAFQHVATRFKNNPQVLGYDLMNEPFPGDLGKAIDGSFQQDWLPKFYNRLIPAMRAVEPDKYLFFEPQSFGINFGFPAALPKIEDTRAAGARLAYAPHLYPLFLHEGVAYNDIDRQQMRDWAKHRSTELDLHQTPLVVGEIGGSDSTPGFGQYIDDAMGMLDQMGGSWAWWANDPGSWGLVDGQGNEMPKTKRLVRTFPHAIAGEPVSYSFVPGAAEFNLHFKQKAGVSGPTEIFVPRRHYPDGWELDVSDPDGTWQSSYDEATQVLKVWTNPAEAEHRIRIYRKYQNIYAPYLGKCLGAESGKTANWTQTVVRDCTGATDEGWIVSADNTIHNQKAPGMCLDVKSALQHNGNRVQLYQCNGSAAQKWHWDSGMLRSGLNANKCLDVAYGGDSTIMQIWDCKNLDSQQFAQRAVTTHQYAAYRNEASGMCLDINNGSMSNGNGVTSWSCHGQSNQKWRFEPLTGLVHSQKDSRYCLDTKGSVQEGGSWAIYRCNRSQNQQFYWTGATLRPLLNIDLLMRGGAQAGSAVVQAAGDGTDPAGRWTTQ